MPPLGLCPEVSLAWEAKTCCPDSASLPARLLSPPGGRAPLFLLKAAPTRSPLLPQGPGPRWRFHSSSTCPGPQSLGPVGAGWGAGGGRVGCAHCFLRGKPPGPCSVPGLSSRAILPTASCRQRWVLLHCATLTVGSPILSVWIVGHFPFGALVNKAALNNLTVSVDICVYFSGINKYLESWTCQVMDRPANVRSC